MRRKKYKVVSRTVRFEQSTYEAVVKNAIVFDEWVRNAIREKLDREKIPYAPYEER